MRIVAGSLGGRMVVRPKTTATRPMMDKVRAALFNTVGNVDGVVVLDAYAGSGAIGLEALSRGAAQVVAIESSHAATKAINANLATLGVTWGYQLYAMTVESWLAHPNQSQAFDLIVADPPYDRLRPDVLDKLGSRLQPDGLLVVSHSSRGPDLNVTGLTLAAHKVYGDTALSFYKPG